MTGMGCNMKNMTKRSFAGRVALMFIFVPVILVELFAKWMSSVADKVRSARIRIHRFADDKFPLKGGKKSGL